MSDAEERRARGGERQRRLWSADQKQRIIAESFEPGASAAEVARRYGLNANMLFTWRRQQRAAGGAGDLGEPVKIVPVTVVTGTALAAPVMAAGPVGQMEIVLGGGERIIVGTDVDTGALSRVVKALARR